MLQVLFGTEARGVGDGVLETKEWCTLIFIWQNGALKSILRLDPYEPSF